MLSALTAVLGQKYIGGVQGPSEHGFALFGTAAPGAPLYAVHGSANLNPHTYDYSFRLKLLTKEGVDITDTVQKMRADAADGQPFYIGFPGEQYLLQQHVGSYFGLPQKKTLANTPLYNSYNPPNAEASGFFKAAGLPIQTVNGADVPTVAGEMVYPDLTVVIDEVMVWRHYSHSDPVTSKLTYSMLGSNTDVFLQHRIAGGSSDWLQTLPVKIDPEFLSSNSMMPSPPRTTLDANGVFVDSTAMRTLDVANGQCTLSVPGRSDTVFSRLIAGESVDVEISCTYYCGLSCAYGATSCSAPAVCLNEFKPFQGMSNNAYLPTKVFKTKITVGKEQALLANNFPFPGGMAMQTVAEGAPSAVRHEANAALTPPSTAAGGTFEQGAFVGLLVGLLVALPMCFVVVRIVPRLQTNAKLLDPEAPRSDGAEPVAGLQPATYKCAMLAVAALALLTAIAGFGALASKATAPPSLVVENAPAARASLSDVVLAPKSAAASLATQANMISVPADHPLLHNQKDEQAAEQYVIEVMSLEHAGREGDYEETHEIWYDSVSHSVFSTQFQSSELMQMVFVGSEAVPAVRRWTVGQGEHLGIAGLHTVTGSNVQPGKLWLTTQLDDKMYMVDPSQNMKVLYDIHVPRIINMAGTTHHIGGPHACIEAPDGTVWVVLKGTNRESPAYSPHAAELQALAEAEFAELNGGEKPPTTYAVWHIDPAKYDTSKYAYGGQLYPAQPTPTMSAVDKYGNSFHTQDQSKYLLRISADGVAEQILMPEGYQSGSGPSVVSDPAGNVWVCSLGSAEGGLVRFQAGSREYKLVTHLLEAKICQGLECLGIHEESNQRRIVHMAFSNKGGKSHNSNVIYILTSSLIFAGADEFVFATELDDDWLNLKEDGDVGHVAIPLPSDHAAAHRLQAIAPTGADDTYAFDNLVKYGGNGVVVTGLVSNDIYYIRAVSI